MRIANLCILTLLLLAFLGVGGCQKKLPKKEDSKKTEEKKGMAAPTVQYGSATLRFLAVPTHRAGDISGDPTEDGDQPHDATGDVPDPTDDTGDKPDDPTSDPGKGKDKEPPTSPIPPSIKKIRVQVSAEDITTPITKDFAVDASSDAFSLEKIPAGAGRKFSIEAQDAEAKALYAGEGTSDIAANKNNEVKIAMKKLDSDPLPQEGNAEIIILWPQDQQ